MDHPRIFKSSERRYEWVQLPFPITPSSTHSSVRYVFRTFWTMLLQPLIVGEFHGNNVDFKAFKLPNFQMVISGGLKANSSISSGA